MLAFFPNKTGSGRIRGVQIAEYLNRPISPESYDSYKCVFIKQRYKDIWPDNSYLDIVDSSALFGSIIDNSKIIPILFTKEGVEYAIKRGRKDAIYIPQHHCNYGNETRGEREIKTVGFIGSRRSFLLDETVVSKELNDIGMSFICKKIPRGDHVTREDIVSFYKEIDIQIYFGSIVKYPFNLFKDSLKLVNAGSFRIPTICMPTKHNVYNFSDSFISIGSEQELISACKLLKDNTSIYNDIANKVYVQAKKYHISKIAMLYLELERQYEKN